MIWKLIEFTVSASTKYSSLHIKSSLLIFWCEINIDIKKIKKIIIEINRPELFSKKTEIKKQKKINNIWFLWNSNPKN